MLEPEQERFEVFEFVQEVSYSFPERCRAALFEDVLCCAHAHCEFSYDDRVVFVHGTCVLERFLVVGIGCDEGSPLPCERPEGFFVLALYCSDESSQFVSYVDERSQILCYSMVNFRSWGERYVVGE